MANEKTQVFRGTVHKIMRQKGYGFFRDESGAEVFFHRSGCRAFSCENGSVTFTKSKDDLWADGGLKIDAPVYFTKARTKKRGSNPEADNWNLQSNGSNGHVATARAMEPSTFDNNQVPVAAHRGSHADQSLISEDQVGAQYAADLKGAATLTEAERKEREDRELLELAASVGGRNTKVARQQAREENPFPREHGSH